LLYFNSGSVEESAMVAVFGFLDASGAITVPKPEAMMDLDCTCEKGSVVYAAKRYLASGWVRRPPVED
jgi:hypothetical protein